MLGEKPMTEGEAVAKKISTARKVGRVIKSVLKVAVAIVLVAVLGVANLVLPGVLSSVGRMANNILGYEQHWDSSKANTDGLDLQYSKADYTADTIKDAQKALDQQIAAEGIVLLQNDDKSLPLAQGTTLSFFGESVKTITASQSMVNQITGGGATDTTAFISAFADHGISVNQDLMDFYTTGAGKDYVMGSGSQGYGVSEDFAINECPLSVMRDAGVLDSAQGTTPVFVLRRVAGEGRDMPRSMYNHAANPADQAKTYLEPDATELEILQYLNDNFDNTVLIVNTASALDLDFLRDMPNIKSVLFVSSLGTYGTDSLAGIMAGDINPSGRTADTFSGNPLGSPAAQNYGDYEYVDESGNLTGYNYATYEEGIYVGYKYYETRYEDAVLGQGNAGSFDYDAEVTHPFGFGLSYTTFDWTNFSTSWNGDKCTATVTVTNTGDRAGKDVVELYAQSPYTDYDRANGVEKAAVELVGFGKTKLLEPGESQTLSIEFDREQLKAYDANGAKTYILDAGTYYVTAGANAHAAENNVLAARGVAAGTETGGNAALVNTYVPDNADVDVTTYATDSKTGAAVINQFDDAAGDATYLTRADWEGTFPKHDGTPMAGQVSTWGNEINGTDGDGNPVSLLYTKTASADLLAKLDSTESGNPVDRASITDEPVYGAKNGLELIDMRGLDYDDPQWNDLLDELTPEDYFLSVGVGGYGTAGLKSVQKPFNVDADTAAGLIYGGSGSMVSGGSMMYCTPVTVAMTYNQEIYAKYGEMIGNEAVLGGASGWYAPSMNIHRTPFTGRNGEYYSEDGFLSGVIGSLEVRGAASKGLYATIKHFALNDQENHRGDTEGQKSMATWANEQAIREIYLKPFEMCTKVDDVQMSYLQKDGDSYKTATREVPACTAVMSAFNRIGATWTGGNYALLTSVLHNEWGFRGWIVTDSASSAGSYMDVSQMIEAGGVSKLAQAENLAKWTFDQNDPAEYHYAREAMHALLYTTANSHVMNGAMHGSVWVDGPQKLEVVRWVATGVSVVGLGLIGFTAWRNHVKRRAERAEQE